MVVHTPGVYAGLSSVNTRNNHRFIIPRFLVQGTWRTGQHHAEGSHLEKLCGRRGNGEEKTEVTTTGTEKNVRKVLGDIFITNSHSLWTQYYQQSRTGLSVTAPLSFAAINLYFPFIVPFFPLWYQIPFLGCERRNHCKLLLFFLRPLPSLFTTTTTTTRILGCKGSDITGRV